jgi:hypothetical protein
MFTHNRPASREVKPRKITGYQATRNLQSNIISQVPMAAARVLKPRPPSEDSSAFEPRDMDLLAHVDCGIVVSELAKGVGVG